MVEERVLAKFEQRLGSYSIAGAIYSHGDVIDFIDGERKGIIIADTAGHRKDFGDEMRGFLRKEIGEGGGACYDAKSEIIDLGKRLAMAGTGKLTITNDDRFSGPDKWWDFAEIQYAQLTEKGIYLAGIDFLLVRKNGCLERIPHLTDEEDQRGTISPYSQFILGRESADVWATRLEAGDVLLMMSDGLGFNINGTYHYSGQKLRKNDNRAIRELEELIKENSTKSVVDIREALIDRFGNFFLPGMFEESVRPSERYDDVTFALLKREV